MELNSTCAWAMCMAPATGLVSFWRACCGRVESTQPYCAAHPEWLTPLPETICRWCNQQSALSVLDLDDPAVVADYLASPELPYNPPF